MRHLHSVTATLFVSHTLRLVRRLTIIECVSYTVCSYTMRLLESVTAKQCDSYTMRKLSSVIVTQFERYRVLQLNSVIATECDSYTA
jgi:hypothetical protein